MKRILIFAIAVVLTVGMAMSVVGCNRDDDNVINIYLPDGAPALALVSVFDKTEIGGQAVKFTVVPSGNITAYLMNGTADLAIVPTNAAAIVYNKEYEYKYVSANTHGNLFMIGRSEVNSLSELKGKKVGVIGRGQVPDRIFQTLLFRNGIEFEEGDEVKDNNKVYITYADDGGVLLPMIKQSKVDFGILGEPAVTTALNSIDGAKMALNIQDAWGNGYPQAGLMVKNSISDDFIKALFDELNKTASFAEENPAEALQRIKDHMLEANETTVKVLTADTVRRSNVKLVKAADCKDDVIELLTAFYDLEPASIGGKLPDDGFFRVI